MGPSGPLGQQDHDHPSGLQDLVDQVHLKNQS